MTSHYFRQAGVILILALVGWALCGAIMMVGRNVTTLETTLLIHAIAAPLVFATLGWIYARSFHYTTPLQTALLWVAIVIALDALVIAPFVEQSYAMFTSVLGTWLPFVLIVVGSYAGGAMVRRSLYATT